MIIKKYTISENTPTRVAALRRANIIHRDLNIATAKQDAYSRAARQGAMYQIHRLVANIMQMLRARGIK